MSEQAPSRKMRRSLIPVLEVIHSSEVSTNFDKDRKSTRLNSSHSSISYAVFFFNDTATTEIYTLSLHDALPICSVAQNAAFLDSGSGSDPFVRSINQF